MSRRRCLLCSLPIVALAFAAAGPARNATAAPVQPDAPSTLVDVKQTGDSSSALPTADATNPQQQAWTVLWDDLNVKPGDAPVVSAGASAIDPRASVTLPSGAPPIIAAPLPPAIISGVIGLVGVYAYKRRNRLR